MIHETVRNLSKLERQSLEEHLNAPSPLSVLEAVKCILTWSAGLLLVLALVVGLIALDPGPIIGGLLGGLLFFPGLICLYALIQVVLTFFNSRKLYSHYVRETLPVMTQILAEGRCWAREVTASEVYEILAFDDEGGGYIFALEGNRSLLLKGQRYFPEVSGMPWPARQFSLVWSVDRDFWIGLFSSGVELDPALTIGMEECRDEFSWSDREDVLDGQPEDILKGLMKSPPQ